MAFDVWGAVVFCSVYAKRQKGEGGLFFFYFFFGWRYYNPPKICGKPKGTSATDAEGPIIYTEICDGIGDMIVETSHPSLLALYVADCSGVVQTCALTPSAATASLLLPSTFRWDQLPSLSFSFTLSLFSYNFHLSCTTMQLITGNEGEQLLRWWYSVCPPIYLDHYLRNHLELYKVSENIR